VAGSDRIPDVGDDSSYVNQWRTPEETSEESRDEERADVLRARLTNMEESVNGDCEDRNVLSPKELRARSPQRRTGNVAQKK
jgi:hypothetical protein